MASRFTATVRAMSASEATASSAMFGTVRTMSVGLVMTRPSSLNWAPPLRTATMQAKNSMLTGMPMTLPRTIEPRLRAERVKSQKFSTNVP